MFIYPYPHTVGTTSEKEKKKKNRALQFFKKSSVNKIFSLVQNLG